MKIILVSTDNYSVLKKTYNFIKNVNNNEWQLHYVVKKNKTKQKILRNYLNELRLILLKFYILNKLNTKLQSNFLITKTTRSNDYDLLLKKINPDITLYILFDEIIKKQTLNLSKINLNVHNAHLPDFRGCRPIHHLTNQFFLDSLLTLHFMEEGIDTGNIVFEIPFRIKKNKKVGRNFIYSISNLDLLIKYGLRRLTKFENFKGLNQSDFNGESNYYKRY